MYILFGAGEYGKRVCSLLGPDKVTYFLDNSNDKIGTIWCDHKVYSIKDKINDISNHKIVISVSKEKEEEIIKQLAGLQIRDYILIHDQIYYSYEDYKKGQDNYVDFFGGMKFYEDSTEFTTKEMFPKQYEMERKFLLESFLPLIGKQAEIADLGCASGEWTSFIADYCKSIDGFDYSARMIDTARKRYCKDNLSFFQVDAKNMSFKKMYDGMVIFGMLMYFLNECDIYDLLKKIKKAVKPGGILAIKDTLNATEDNDVFLYNPLSGYSGCYRNQNHYYKLFYETGFELIDDALLMNRGSDERKIGYISRGTLWRVL